MRKKCLMKIQNQVLFELTKQPFEQKVKPGIKTQYPTTTGNKTRRGA